MEFRYDRMRVEGFGPVIAPMRSPRRRATLVVARSRPVTVVPSTNTIVSSLISSHSFAGSKTALVHLAVGRARQLAQPHQPWNHVPRQGFGQVSTDVAFVRGVADVERHEVTPGNVLAEHDRHLVDAGVEANGVLDIAE